MAVTTTIVAFALALLLAYHAFFAPSRPEAEDPVEDEDPPLQTCPGSFPPILSPRAAPAAGQIVGSSRASTGASKQSAPAAASAAATTTISSCSSSTTITVITSDTSTTTTFTTPCFSPGYIRPHPRFIGTVWENRGIGFYTFRPSTYGPLQHRNSGERPSPTSSSRNGTDAVQPPSSGQDDSTTSSSQHATDVVSTGIQPAVTESQALTIPSRELVGIGCQPESTESQALTIPSWELVNHSVESQPSALWLQLNGMGPKPASVSAWHFDPMPAIMAHAIPQQNVMQYNAQNIPAIDGSGALMNHDAVVPTIAGPETLMICGTEGVTAPDGSDGENDQASDGEEDPMLYVSNGGSVTEDLFDLQIDNGAHMDVFGGERAPSVELDSGATRTCPVLSDEFDDSMVLDPSPPALENQQQPGPVSPSNIPMISPILPAESVEIDMSEACAPASPPPYREPTRPRAAEEETGIKRNHVRPGPPNLQMLRSTQAQAQAQPAPEEQTVIKRNFAPAGPPSLLMIPLTQAQAAPPAQSSQDMNAASYQTQMQAAPPAPPSHQMNPASYQPPSTNVATTAAASSSSAPAAPGSNPLLMLGSDDERRQEIFEWITDFHDYFVDSFNAENERRYNRILENSMWPATLAELSTRLDWIQQWVGEPWDLNKISYVQAKQIELIGFPWYRDACRGVMKVRDLMADTPQQERAEVMRQTMRMAMKMNKLNGNIHAAFGFAAKMANDACPVPVADRQ